MYLSRVTRRALMLVLTLIVIVNIFTYTSRPVSPKSVIIDRSAPDRTRTILLWNSFFGDRTYDFGEGNEPFMTTKCDRLDCYATSDRRWLPVERYDAIVFHGPEYHPYWQNDIPERRTTSQRYVYLSSESPTSRPVKQAILDVDFFNWTMTYRIDSDVQLFYVNIYSKIDGQRIAPSHAPPWTKTAFDSSKYRLLFDSKSKPVAWFVSNCDSSNSRERIAQELGRYLKVDVYGKCGTMSCPRSDSAECFAMLKRDYYFYLAMENSNCVDYVTEKVLNAYENDVIPIVYGGADYKKFLPPDSYLDAGAVSPEVLAREMVRLMGDRDAYLSYFWWKDLYVFKSAPSPFCTLCTMLFDESLPAKSYRLIEWWHGGNGSMCQN